MKGFMNSWEVYLLSAATNSKPKDFYAILLNSSAFCMLLATTAVAQYQIVLQRRKIIAANTRLEILLCGQWVR